MKKIIVTISLFLSGATIFAQDYASDAGHMIRTDLIGTARSLGAGGAFSTVGADMSSMDLNPAGIALYRSHEFAVSGGAIWGNTSTSYLGNTSSTDLLKGTFTQAGLIFATRRLSHYDNLSYNRGGSALDRVVFGFGYQKLADFSRTDYFYGTNTQSSYAQAIAYDQNKNISNINSLGSFSIPEVNAFQTYVTDTANGNAFSKIGLPVSQMGSISTQGSISELNFTMGFNIGNTVYIGAGVGVPYLQYSRYVTFTESNTAADSGYTSNYGYSYKGWGVNGKLGVIVKPVQWLRIGAAVQSPTRYRLHETDYGNTSSGFGDTTGYSNSSSSFYNLTYNNPLKGTFGASFYLNKWGFLSVDYELDDYAHTHYTFDNSSDANYWNNIISTNYRLTSSVRAGAEFAYKSLRLRAGFAWAQSPFQNNLPGSGYSSGDRFNYTAGIGYRGRHFFADLAYVRTQYKDYYAPYSYQTGAATEAPGVYNTFSLNTIIATVGFKFGGGRN